MTGYVITFESNKTMSFKISDKQYNQIWKKVEKVLKREFDSKPVYGNDDRYIKTKIICMVVVCLQIFKVKKCLKKKHHASAYQ